VSPASSVATAYWRLQRRLATTLLPDVVRLEALARAPGEGLPPAAAARVARLRTRTLAPLLARLREAPSAESGRPPTAADVAALRRAAAVLPPYVRALRAALLGAPPPFDCEARGAAPAA
jgi:hypothetical protein